MARSVRHLSGIAALLAERGIDLVVLKQGIDTATVAGQFTFHVLAAMDEMLADLICEGTKEGLASARARGRVGGRKPRLSARQAEVARGMYAETGSDGKRRYAVDEIAGTFAVSSTIRTSPRRSALAHQPRMATRTRTAMSRRQQ
jgi:DNA invertase Pin-like site-specific DNA recombinase